MLVLVSSQGIYRISGVKSKVEKLCQSFESDENNVDLSEHHVNVIANVLKLYLRQVHVTSLNSGIRSVPRQMRILCLEASCL